MRRSPSEPRFLLLLWLMLAAACPAAATSVVLVVGDSLSAGYGMAVEDGWVALLQEHLSARDYGYRVVNASISGDTTRGGRARLPRALQVHQPSVVIIELGGNDGLRGQPIAQMRANLEAMVEAARAAGASVLLTGVHIPPNYGRDYAESFHAVYQELAEQRGVGLVPHLLDKVALDPDLMQDDGIHPNAAAQTLILENVWARLEPLLNREE